MTLEHGTSLQGRYRIVETLNRGAMSTVYRAADERGGMDVAVKENISKTDEYVRQFRLQAVILANLQHPNLPRGLDHFVIPDQGQYLVMDYIEGEDLDQRLERTGNITEDETILIGAAVCDLLSYLHSRNPPIIHRNLQPANVKITPDEHIFVVGFGLVKVLDGRPAMVTEAGAMNSKQPRTAHTDERTDIYSLGATLYNSLSGVIPEDGLARAMDNTRLTPLRKHNPKISKLLAAAIEKAMAVDPANRFQSAEDFRGALLDTRN